MIAFTIDELTPCLVDTLTGETIQTEVVELKRKSFLAKFNSRNGWYINWSKFAPGVRIFALVIHGTMDIQGLIALEPNPGYKATHILWACTAPHNNIWENGEQKYKGVGGHLFAIASEMSIKQGFDGTVYGEAMDEEILKYYVKQFGANRLPKAIHPYAMAINSATAKRIREVYDYDWSDEII